MNEQKTNVNRFSFHPISVWFFCVFFSRSFGKQMHTFVIVVLTRTPQQHMLSCTHSFSYIFFFWYSTRKWKMKKKCEPAEPEKMHYSKDEYLSKHSEPTTTFGLMVIRRLSAHEYATVSSVVAHSSAHCRKNCNWIKRAENNSKAKGRCAVRLGSQRKMRRSKKERTNLLHLSAT